MYHVRAAAAGKIVVVGRAGVGERHGYAQRWAALHQIDGADFTLQRWAGIGRADQEFVVAVAVAVAGHAYRLAGLIATADAIQLPPGISGQVVHYDRSPECRLAKDDVRPPGEARAAAAGRGRADDDVIPAVAVDVGRGHGRAHAAIGFGAAQPEAVAAV